MPGVVQLSGWKVPLSHFNYIKFFSRNSWSYSCPIKGYFWLGLNKKGMIGKWFQTSFSTAYSNNSLVVRKRDRLLGRQLFIIWAPCVCADIHNCIMWEQGKQWGWMNFRNGNTLIFAWTVHFRVYVFHWLKNSSISPRWLLTYQIKFQINLNFKVPKLVFLLT